MQSVDADRQQSSPVVPPFFAWQVHGWQYSTKRSLCAIQVYGTLIELFDCRRELYTATEVVANNSLFHVVVGKEEEAGRLS